MKRVLLLVCLIVSLVELDWERYRIYLLFSIASLSLVLHAEWVRCHRVQRETEVKAFQTCANLSSDTLASGSLHLDNQTEDTDEGPSRGATKAALSTMASTASTATSPPAKCESVVEESSGCLDLVHERVVDHAFVRSMGD